MSNKVSTQKPRRKKKGRGKLIAVIVVLLLVGAAAAVFVFDPFNFNIRDRVYDTMRGWPLVGGLIPESDENGSIPRVSTTDLQAQNDLLRRQLEGAQRDTVNMRTQRDGLQIENERLRSFEAEIEQHRLNVNDFNEMVLRQVGLAEYWRFFQQFHPDQAEEFAREAAGDAHVSREVRNYINTVRELAPRSAANIIEELMDVHIDIVVPIMERLSPEERAMIIGSMEVEKAAVILRLMFPEGMQ